MTTVAPPALPAVVTLQEWDRGPWPEDVRELVDGTPTMTPSEAFDNHHAAWQLANALNAALGPAWLPGLHFDVELQPGRRGPTVRCPDLVLVEAGFDGRRSRALPAEVALVVEFVSPESTERDWVTKRAEYAAAGIPRYLVVDLSGPVRRMALFDRIESGAYADPTHPADQVTVTIDGAAVTIRLADLLRR